MASASTANPQTFNRYSYVTNSPLALVDPTGMFGICPGGSQLGGIGGLTSFSPYGQTLDQRSQTSPGQPPPPGGPVSPGPIKIDIGPVPLLDGEVAWPTILEIVENPNKTYNGNPVISPSGIVIDDQPHYGVGRTVDYIVRDQAGNPMSGMLIQEQVKPTNGDAEDLWEVVRVNMQPQKTDENGIVPDTLGFVSPSRASLTYIEQNPRINATFTQTLSVYGIFGQEFRTAIKVVNHYRLTKSGVAIVRGPSEQRARPTK